MAHSFAERPPLQCPECGTSFTPEIWLILDAAERPDLIDRAADGTLHHVTCPNGHPSAVDAPLVIFRRAEARPVIFSPQQQTSQAEDEAAANGLINRLADSLGDQWQDEWLDSTAYVPRRFLAVALSDDPAALAEAAAEAVPPEVEAALAEIAATLEADGVVLESPEDLERALDARPELRDRLLAAAVADDPPDESENPRSGPDATGFHRGRDMG